LQFLLEF